jgi:hypothetical protein
MYNFAQGPEPASNTERYDFSQDYPYEGDNDEEDETAVVDLKEGDIMEEGDITTVPGLNSTRSLVPVEQDRSRKRRRDDEQLDHEGRRVAFEM